MAGYLLHTTSDLAETSTFTSNSANMPLTELPAIEFLRTPESRFEGISDYPFSPHYVQVSNGLRMHYLDEGPKDAPIIMLWHGEPSWSYLYRTMIPPLVQAGFRVMAPDLIGFGKSDKPIHMEDYSYERYLNWMWDWMDAVSIEQAHLFCQDWGGLLGLRMVADQPNRFDRVIAANTILPTGDNPPNEAFQKWQKFAAEVPVFPVSNIIQRATVSELSAETLAAYDMPFPDESYKAGARIFPALVPVTPDDPQSQPNRLAWQSLAQRTQPFLTLFSDSDPIMSGLEKLFIKIVPGAKGQPHTTIPQGGHFLQEDQGPLIAEHIIQFLQQPASQS
ncbi:haloalkane dehalogenase [Pontibacter sp. G13]|uniref:haloalkane dehalogenase n=1 Tax=Pontibacter sp. G13 TaxID=3074898 RepID=UPI00288C1F82|nr:haloalkane dehalogenase [Pontibacter sp. G13]WNJ20619.1 haloalkane dehalogenase [Pontibacter sp. G13]